MTGLAGPPPSAAVEHLLRQVAKLCTLARVPKETALKLLEGAYLELNQSREESTEYIASDADMFAAAQVLSEWHQNSVYLSDAGSPRAIATDSCEFQELCSTAGITTDCTRLLDLLVQAGAVTVDSKLISPVRRDLMLDYAHPAAVMRALHIVSEYAATLHHNLSRSIQDPGLFERTVMSTRLPRRQVPALLAYLSVHGESFLEDLDAWMSAREHEGGSSSRIGVGVYLFVGNNN
jgi:hypothetical protein